MFFGWISKFPAFQEEDEEDRKAAKAAACQQCEQLRAEVSEAAMARVGHVARIAELEQQLTKHRATSTEQLKAHKAREAELESHVRCATYTSSLFSCHFPPVFEQCACARKSLPFLRSPWQPFDAHLR